MRYAFTFDASSCTGCKACQVACKDKNELPAGVLWRRVYEVSGGSWQQRGAAWTNTVFAYNVSMGCNHCADPACARACPTGAYVVRDDGIVYQEGEKCVGCEYCSWACPYGAPQYSPDLGRTTKCDFCRDLIDEGLPPACVAACPMRALDLIEIETRSGTEGRSRAETQRAAGSGFSVLGFSGSGSESAAELPFPLPAGSRTQPSIAIKPHQAMLNDLQKVVANYEEVRSTRWHVPSGIRHLVSSRWHPGEWPLVAFTLLGQAAAGVACISLFTGRLSPGVLATIGVLLAAAALSSLLHLGSASSAWRATANVKRSRLSREIVMLAAFGAAWLVTFVAPRAGQMAMAVCGAALVYGMAQVYRLDAVPPWNTWRTVLSFAVSALLLGLLVGTVATMVSGVETSAWIWRLAGVILAFEAWLALSDSTVGFEAKRRLRVALILTAMVGIAILPFVKSSAALEMAALILVASLGQECLARAGFYSALRQKTM